LNPPKQKGENQEDNFQGELNTCKTSSKELQKNDLLGSNLLLFSAENTYRNRQQFPRGLRRVFVLLETKLCAGD